MCLSIAWIMAASIFTSMDLPGRYRRFGTVLSAWTGLVCLEAVDIGP